MRVVGARNEFQQVSRQPIVVPPATVLGHRPMVLVRHQVPLTDITRLIPRFTEVTAEHFKVRVRPFAIPPDSGLRRVDPGLQTRPRRTTHRLTGEAVVDVSSASRHAVEIRSQPEGIAVRAGRIGPLLIGEKDNDVRTVLRHGVRK